MRKTNLIKISGQFLFFLEYILQLYVCFKLDWLHYGLHLQYICVSRIKHTYILDDPFDDPSQLAELIPDASPEGKPKDEVVANCNFFQHLSCSVKPQNEDKNET